MKPEGWKSDGSKKRINGKRMDPLGNNENGWMKPEGWKRMDPTDQWQTDGSLWGNNENEWMKPEGWKRMDPKRINGKRMDPFQENWKRMDQARRLDKRIQKNDQWQTDDPF
jgi:hypothetical protein